MAYSFSPLSMISAVVLSYMAFIMLSTFLLYLFCWEFLIINGCCMLYLVKCLLCIYWDDHVVFIPHSVNVVYHIDWFADVEPSLCPWYKSYLIVVYDLFNILLYSIFQYFGFCIYIHQRYWSVVFLLCVVLVWLQYQGDVGFTECVGKCSIFLYFLE